MSEPLNSFDEQKLTNLFHKFTTEQRYSTLNLLHMIGNIEGSEHKAEAVLLALNFYVRIFSVKAQDAMNYFSFYGLPALVSDLKALPKQLKELLLLMCNDLISLGGKPTHNEVMFMGNFFNELGLSNRECSEILVKSSLIKELTKDEPKWVPKDPNYKMDIETIQSIIAEALRLQNNGQNKGEV